MGFLALFVAFISLLKWELKAASEREMVVERLLTKHGSSMEEAQ